MYSPVTGLPAPVVDSFSVNEIIKGYKTELGIDVQAYFKGKTNLNLYQCSDTGLRFFYPAALAGDPAFYTALENRPGYYRDWKWEYDEAFQLIEDGVSVLDIGCGRGAFLKKLKAEKDCVVTGLELNPNAFKQLLAGGMPAFQETIETHSEIHTEAYDVVAFFQVLEHISDVNSFITTALKCLKKNGLLILAVPNNAPYMMGINKYEWLNLPPHHMGWWNEASLTQLSRFFPMTVQRIQACPFRDYNAYLDALERNAKIENGAKLGWIKTTRPIRKQWIQL
ncbi:MAG TPA: class I SAM-dependent methyltransferase, partial [Chitinophagaceae bacterium]|nr:class I SAM-dependent methyltransferase [Chitinophagaceae bacterium]